MISVDSALKALERGDVSRPGNDCSKLPHTSSPSCMTEVTGEVTEVDSFKLGAKIIEEGEVSSPVHKYVASSLAAAACDPIERLAGIRREFGEHGGVNASVEASTTFTVLAAKTIPDIFEGKTEGCFLYGRHFNPTVVALSRQLAAIEGTESAYCTASGMSAIACALLGLLDTGDHLVATDTLYGGTWALLAEFLPQKCGITCTFVNVQDPEAVAEAMIEGKTKVLYVETISNPTLRLSNIPMLAQIAHGMGAKMVVDNTFAPLVVTPADHGADVVVHSLTKFINGGSDYIAGCVCGSNKFINSLMDLHTGPLMLLGPTMDPHVAHAISLRIPHLPLRMAEHARRAQLLAERLSELGINVSYPGLKEHPDHALLLAIGREEFGGGGVITIDCGSKLKAEELMDELQNKHGFGYVAVSLGYFDTLMSCSASSTSSEMDEFSRTQSGIGQGLVRMSVGFTGSRDQRWRQLRCALQSVGLTTAESAQRGEGI